MRRRNLFGLWMALSVICAPWGILSDGAGYFYSTNGKAIWGYTWFPLFLKMPASYTFLQDFFLLNSLFILGLLAIFNGVYELTKVFRN